MNNIQNFIHRSTAVQFKKKANTQKTRIHVACLIAATVMTFSVLEGHSLLQVFSSAIFLQTQGR